MIKNLLGVGLGRYSFDGDTNDFPMWFSSKIHDVQNSSEIF